MIQLLFFLGIANVILALWAVHQQRNVGRIARLHVVMQFELASGQFEEADADLAALELIPGGVDKELAAMFRATIDAGYAQRMPPPATARPVFDEGSQSYLTGGTIAVTPAFCDEVRAMSQDDPYRPAGRSDRA